MIEIAVDPKIWEWVRENWQCLSVLSAVVLWYAVALVVVRFTNEYRVERVGTWLFSPLIVSWFMAVLFFKLVFGGKV